MKKHSSTKKFVVAAALATTLASFAHAAPPVPTFTWDNYTSSIDGVTYLIDDHLKDPWGLVPGEEGKTIWVANELTGTVTRYLLDGEKFGFGGTKAVPTFTPEVVTIPSATTGTGSPTGIVYNHAAFLPIVDSNVEFPQAYSQSGTVKGGDDIVLTTDTDVFVVGMPVNDGGNVIPSGTTIKSILSGNGFVMSAKATGTAAVTETLNFTIPSRWLSVTEDGLIVGFNGGTVTAANNSALFATVLKTVTGAVYTGCTLAYTGGTGSANHQLFAANFATGMIDVFDNDSGLTQGTSFSDTNLPAVPTTGDAWKPYNVKRYATADKSVTGDTTGKKIKRVLLVAYVLVDSTDAIISGEGDGFVDVFTTAGVFVTRLAAPVVSTAAAPNDDSINTPWGMAIFRETTHQAGDKLFLTNQGNGVTLSYSLAGVFTATSSTPPVTPTELDRPDGYPLRFNNLHAIHFGLKPESISAYAADEDELDNGDGTLYFDADLFGQTRGLFGRIFAKPAL
jgi:flagellar hook protein FlgE